MYHRKRKRDSNIMLGNNNIHATANTLAVLTYYVWQALQYQAVLAAPLPRSPYFAPAAPPSLLPHFTIAAPHLLHPHVAPDAPQLVP
jgi:hypothetical protein